MSAAISVDLFSLIIATISLYTVLVSFSHQLMAMTTCYYSFLFFSFLGTCTILWLADLHQHWHNYYLSFFLCVVSAYHNIGGSLQSCAGKTAISVA